MERRADRLTEAAVKQLLGTLERNAEDAALVLELYESTHGEADESQHYRALVAGEAALREAIERINDQLNKK